MKIAAYEPTTEKHSIGFQYILQRARDAGYDITYCDDYPDGGYDLVLISVHHFRDLHTLYNIKRNNMPRLMGGHILLSNPYPFKHYTDYMLIGEGESWIVPALKQFEEQGSIDLAGTWHCQNEPPEPIYEPDCPSNPPKLNIYGDDIDGHAPNWYIEIARGCPYNCAYCELGSTAPYRWKPLDVVISEIDMIDSTISKRVALLAPDQASHPHYQEIHNYILSKGYFSMFGSFRLDRVIKSEIEFRQNMTIRVGVDGLSERLRYAVNKRISDNDILRYFKFMIDQGHVNFKIFQMFGFPNETLQDLAQWELLVNKISLIPKKHIHIRVKFTPLIPQMKTPLQDFKAVYRFDIANAIAEWHKKYRSIFKGKQIDLEMDGTIMGYKTWKEEARLAKCKHY